MLELVSIVFWWVSWDLAFSGLFQITAPVISGILVFCVFKHIKYFKDSIKRIHFRIESSNYGQFQGNSRLQ